MGVNTQLVEDHNLATLTERLEGFEEKTVRRYFDKILEQLEIDKKEVKNDQGHIVFSSDLEDFLVWIYKKVDSNFFSKALNGKMVTLEDGIEFQDDLLLYANSLPEEERNTILQIAENLALRNSKVLFQQTLEKARIAAALFEELPPKDRIIILEKLNEEIDSWIVTQKNRLNIK